MEPTAVETAQPTAVAQAAPARAEKHVSASPVVDKFAEARRAKKKARRVTHRRTIKRSNTNG